MISVHDVGAADALGDLSRFRQEFYQCLTARADALFELSDAVLCTDGPVTSLVELSLAAEHRRGHGALYDSLNQGRNDIGRFRNNDVGWRWPAITGSPLAPVSSARITWPPVCRNSPGNGSGRARARKDTGSMTGACHVFCVSQR